MQKNCGFSCGNPRDCRSWAVWMMEQGENEPFVRLKPFCKSATAVQHFLLLLQKKTLAKENEPGGISISLRTSLNRPRKPLRFSWIFPAKFDGDTPRISFLRIPSRLSLWERWPSKARTERVDCDCQVPSQSPAATALPEGEPRAFPSGEGGAKRRMRVGEHYRYCKANILVLTDPHQSRLRRASFPQGKPTRPSETYQLRINPRQPNSESSEKPSDL